nr:uncharacterized protein LOC109409873 [Aedes albopictus]
MHICDKSLSRPCNFTTDGPPFIESLHQVQHSLSTELLSFVKTFLTSAISFSFLFLFQIPHDTTESMITVDWENGFVEASAKLNQNISQVFKELLAQAKITYNLSPALRRRRRQSLPQHASAGGGGGGGGGGTGPSTPSQNIPPTSSHVPSAAQLAHLQQIQDKSLGGKRNSCILS